MKLDVIGLDGGSKGSVDLNGNLFGLEVREDILARVIHWQLANRQAGTHHTKDISEVSGSTKKIVRQKGSGGARHGSKRAPNFRGGSIIFGPKTRSHGYSLPKKIRTLGLKMALSAKAKMGDLIIVDSVDIADGKTKVALASFKNLAAKNLLIIDKNDLSQSCKKAVANIHGYDILPTIGANVYDIIRKDKLIITVDALAGLEERLK